MVTDGYDSFINYVLTQTHEEGQVNFSHAFILCNGKKLPTPKQTHPPPKKKKNLEESQQILIHTVSVRSSHSYS